MDIKSKNSSMKYSLLAAVLIVALCSIIFVAQYPHFKRNAQVLNHRNELQDEDFLTRLNVSNYIFYKDIVEKVEQKNYSYGDLYLSLEAAEQETWRDEYILSEDKSYLSENTDSGTEWLEEELLQTLKEDWSSAASEVSQLMDYCVVDHKTGEYIKNTGRNIETLAGLGSGNGIENGTESGIENGIENGTESFRTQTDSRDNAQEDYEYYVVVSYDSVGNPDRVAVKDENPDELLKRVQNVMKSRPLEKWMRNINGQGSGEGIVYGYSEAEHSTQTIRYRLGAPHDVTFIYAMTESQKAVMQARNQEPVWYTYYQSGAPESYAGMLFLLAFVTLVLMRFKWYGLHLTHTVRIPLEISVLAVLVWFAGFSELVMEMVRITCTGEFSALLEENLPYRFADYCQTVTLLLNFLFLFLLFGGWFYIVNSFGGVFVLGIKGFLTERSMVVKAGAWIWNAFKRHYGRFKQEMLHVDLGESAIKMVRKVVILNFLLLAVMCSMWFFGWMALTGYSVALYFLLKKYVNRIQKQYGKMLEATNSIAEGNLNTVFDEDLGVFESYKQELYRIQEGFRKAVDEEVKSQRMKTELITNVSHDLKTPLTAITTYIDLLKEENLTEEQRKEYIAVLEKKSLRLKTLIEDLFEVSRANSRNVSVNLVDVDICNLMRQVYLEYEDRVEEAGLIFRFRMPQEKVIRKLDSQKTYRIFENLYINIIKYAMPGTRVYVDVAQEETEVRIELKNMSATELQVEPDELTERFVRGDSSRNTEGSGLGLAIAKSFVQIQGGRMEVTVDGDLFKVVLWF